MGEWSIKYALYCIGYKEIDSHGNSLFSSPLQPDFNIFGDLKREKCLTMPQTQCNIFICLQDHGDEVPLANIKIERQR